MLLIFLLGILVIIFLCWIFSCYFVAYSYFQIGTKDGDDIYLNEASRYLGYASLTSWVIFLIIVIILIVGLVLLIILSIFVPEILPKVFKFATKILIPKPNSIISTIFAVLFIVLGTILTVLTGYFTAIAAFNINKGVYSDQDSYEIKKSLKYCYITTAISIFVIILLVSYVVLYFYLRSQEKKAKKQKEVLAEKTKKEASEAQAEAQAEELSAQFSKALSKQETLKSAEST